MVLHETSKENFPPERAVKYQVWWGRYFVFLFTLLELPDADLLDNSIERQSFMDCMPQVLNIARLVKSPD